MLHTDFIELQKFYLSPHGIILSLHTQPNWKLCSTNTITIKELMTL